jgi:hypothetical protein
MKEERNRREAEEEKEREKELHQAFGKFFILDNPVVCFQK